MRYLRNVYGVLEMKVFTSPRSTLPTLLRSDRYIGSFLLVVVVFCSFLTVTGKDIRQVNDESRKLLKDAEKLVKQGNYPEAEQIFRRISELYPTNSEVKLKLAFTLLKLQRLDEAYDIGLAVAKAEPKNSYAYAVLGSTLVSAGRLADARNVLFTSLKLNRQEALAWAGLGMVEFFENRIDDSLRNLREAVFHDGSEPDHVFALAQVSARAEKYGEAADSYYRFLRISKALDHDRRDRIKGLINFLRFLAGKEKLYVSSGPEVTTVQFDLMRNRPVIELKVNDHDAPLKFVLDTGSGISVISDDTAKALGIRAITKGGFARGIGGDGRFEIVYGFLQQVSVGETRVRNVPVFIRKFHSPSIDGYIGLALISKFLTTIDYGTKTFSLATRKGPVSVDDARSVTVPLRLTSSGFLSGEVQVAGVESPLNFIVDTGASVSVVSDDVANLAAFDAFERGEKMRVIGAAGIAENVPSFLLPKVSLGANTLESVTAIALDLDTINEASGFQQSGILGGNFLKNYRMTFDIKNSKVTLIPIEKAP